MLHRHLHVPHTFHVIEESPLELYPYSDMRIHPTYTDHANMVANNRSCFRRLRLLDRDMADVLGPRILQLDLDVVITGDVTELFTRTEPVVVCRQTSVVRKDGHERTTYNPSMLLFDAGALHGVWERFHASPLNVWNAAKSHGWACTDMAILNDWFNAPGGVNRPAIWTEKDGVVTYWREVRRNNHNLPDGARVVLFYGRQNPGDPDVQKACPWILSHWR